MSPEGSSCDDVTGRNTPEHATAGKIPNPGNATLPLPGSTPPKESVAESSAGDTAVDRPLVPGYEILGKLGRGGMGVVYHARQLGLNRSVALKMILAGAEETELARFRAEAEAVAQLQHPNIVQIYEVGEANGRPFFSLEFVDSGSLDQWLNGTPLAPDQAAALVETLARAMAAAHRCGIVHRDLKPANVLLQNLTQRRQDAKKEEEREEERNTPGSSSALCALASLREVLPKITDFGLAKRLDLPAGQTQSGAILGTPSYMAPEQAGGKGRELGPAADLYALGAILYECLTGRPPFRAATTMDTVLQVLHDEPVPPRRLQPTVPRDLDSICLKCLEKDPRQRYTTGEALAEDLRRFRAGEPIAARRPGPLGRAWRWSRRNRALAAALAATALCLILGTAISTALALWALANAREARSSAAQAAAREREVRDEQEKTRAALAAEARRRRQTREALDTLTDGVVGELLARRQGLEPEQKAFLENVLRLQEEFARDVGDDVESLQGAAEGHRRVAAIQHRLSRLAEAEAAFRAALALYERLDQVNPGARSQAARQASCWNDLGNLLREAGRNREADEALQRALQLSGQGAGNAALAGAKARMNQALNRELSGDLKGAVGGYRAVLADLAPAEAGPAISEAALSLLAQCHSNLGSALNTQGHNAEAAEHLGKAVANLRLLGRQFPRAVEHRSGLAKALHNLGSAQEGLGKSAEAEKLFREATEVEKQVVTEYPGVPEYQADLANHLDRLASVLRRTGRGAEAESRYREAVTAAARAARDRPQSAELRMQEAGARENLALLLAEAGRLTEAEPVLREALAVWQSLVRDLPSNPRVALGSVHARLNLVHLLGDRARNQEAATEAGAVVQLLEEMTARQPPSSQVRALLAQGLLSRAYYQARLHQWTDAAATLDRLTGKEDIPDAFMLETARIYARAAAATASDPTRAEQRARQALDQLRRARKAGIFRDPAAKKELHDGVDFTALRTRQDFQDLLREIDRP
jgi:serine/threonine protein kinase